MIKKIIFISIVFFSISSCVNSQSSKVQKPKETPNTKKETPKKTTPKKSNYIMSTSRQKSEIDANYPFDIDLKTSKGILVNSQNVLPQNGKPTVLLFWLTTCYPCRLEMKAIKENFPSWIAETDFNLVAISTDFPKNHERAYKLIKKEGWQWKTYIDANREFRWVMPGELNGLPQLFIFDKDGKIVHHKKKYSSGDEHKLYDKIKEIVNKG